MDAQIIFWVMVAIAFVEVLAIIVIGRAIKAVLKSDYFINKVKKEGNSGMKVLLMVVGLFLSSQLFAAEANPENQFYLEVSQTTLYAMLAVNVMLFFIIRYFQKMLQNLITAPDRKAQAVEVASKPSFVKKALHVLTDSVSLEEEFKVETDHEYDGIRELDNNLPPWWKWGFYVSIFAGVIYMFNFHILKTGDLQEAEYEKSIAQAEIEIQKYLADKALNVDENSVVFLEDAKALTRGKGTFNQYCVVCHGAEGEGKVGPNLCDEYWIHGGDIKDVFSTITYGAKNGMKSWKDELNPVQIQEVASFVMTFKGTTPANAKAPQGELWQAEDKSTSQQDSIPSDLSALK
ncbi:MAG: c-type cytochrome [Flavobacteriales bacterium]|nr:c-type cytochrome [Flavobacteriales bacterium]